MQGQSKPSLIHEKLTFHLQLDRLQPSLGNPEPFDSPSEQV